MRLDRVARQATTRPARRAAGLAIKPHERRDTALRAAIRPRATATIRPQRPATPPGARASGRAFAYLGVLLGQQAVHLVHSACFWT